MYPEIYNKNYKLLIENERGYVPPTTTTDLGGETINGISRRFFPDWDGWVIVDRFDDKSKHSVMWSDLEPLIKNFYYENFWKKICLHREPPKSHWGVYEELFDTAVNQSKKSAIKYLQKSLNKLNNNSEYYPNINEDGVIGKVTIGTINKYLKARRDSDDSKIKVLLSLLNTYQAMRYLSIVDRDENQEANIYGWFRLRVSSI